MFPESHGFVAMPITSSNNFVSTILHSNLSLSVKEDEIVRECDRHRNETVILMKNLQAVLWSDIGILMRLLFTEEVKLYYSNWCIPIWLMHYWHGVDRDELMLLRLSVLTGEHANYSQIKTTGCSRFTQFIVI